MKTEMESHEYLEEWKLDDGYYPRNKKNTQWDGMELVVVILNLNLREFAMTVEVTRKTFHK